MAFELVTKPESGSRNPPMTCSVSKSVIVFSQDLYPDLEKTRNIEIYHDKKEQKFGFKQVKERTKNSYTFNRHGINFPKKLLCILELGMYPVKKEGDMLLIYSKDKKETPTQKKINLGRKEILEEHQKTMSKKMIKTNERRL